MPGRWSGFIAEGDGAKALHEVGNPDHRVRVEHDRDRLFINLSDEDGKGWTVIAVDRKTREYGGGSIEHRKLQPASLTSRSPTDSDPHSRSP